MGGPHPKAGMDPMLSTRLYYVGNGSPRWAPDCNVEVWVAPPKAGMDPMLSTRLYYVGNGKPHVGRQIVM
ncbi:hypothetical protein CEXT_296221 [Caerostris extrusa]|uniref:Uncharacterized protein n=1 Tax=Caerostris extrusa TaxID=172846 RepID=A0AAV4UB09_CAEEX|nr:hypothetical protein CEXT_296221 [Caerostris extrusa]